MKACLKRANKLLTHERNGRITLGYNRFLNRRTNKVFGWDFFLVTELKRSELSVMDDKKKIYSGLTHKLRDVFWPETEEDPWKRSKEEVKNRKTKSVYAPSKIRRTCLTYGAKHGTEVHRQVSHYVDLRSRDSDRRGDAVEAFLERFPEPDPCTVRILKFLAKKSWDPIASEFQVWDKKMRTATAIDLVVVDVARCKLIAIEVKTGYENEEYSQHPSDGNMAFPLDNVPNCPMWRHQLQIMAGVGMISGNYGLKIDEFYVLRACSKKKGVILIEGAPWCADRDNQRLVKEAVIAFDRRKKK